MQLLDFWQDIRLDCYHITFFKTLNWNEMKWNRYHTVQIYIIFEKLTSSPSVGPYSASYSLYAPSKLSINYWLISFFMWQHLFPSTIRIWTKRWWFSSVADPGSGGFLAPGSGMNFFRIPDLGSKGYVFGEIFLRILVL
jgi:hypothetical protein